MPRYTNGFEFPDPDSDIYVSCDTLEMGRIDRLRPLETPLSFHRDFINEVATNDAIEVMALYTNGWEL